MIPVVPFIPMPITLRLFCRLVPIALMLPAAVSAQSAADSGNATKTVRVARVDLLPTAARLPATVV